MASGGSVSQLGSINAGEYQASLADMRAMQQMLLQERARRDALAQQAMQRQRDDDLARQQLEFQKQSAADRLALASREEARRGTEADRSYELNKAYLELQRNQPSKSDDYINRELFGLADQEAEAGTFDPNAYPALKPEQKTALLAKRDASRKSIESDYAQLQNVASARNRVQQLKNYIALSTEAQKEAPSSVPSESGLAARRWLNAAMRIGGVPYQVSVPSANAETKQDITGDITDWSTEQQALQAQDAAYQQIQKGRFGIGNLTQDPVTLQWRPSQPLPWQTSGTMTNGAARGYIGTGTGTNAVPPRPIIKYDPRSGRPIAYDPVTKQPLGYADGQ